MISSAVAYLRPSLSDRLASLIQYCLWGCLIYYLYQSFHGRKAIPSFSNPYYTTITSEIGALRATLDRSLRHMDAMDTGILFLTGVAVLYWLMRIGESIVDVVVNAKWARLLPYVPVVREIVAKKTQEAEDDIRKSLLKCRTTRTTELPEAGWDADLILDRVGQWSELEKREWREGKASGAVYSGQDDLMDLIGEVYKRFSLSNPLHPDIFPFTRQMEAEVVSMVADLFNGDEQTCGCVTSGGTESIMMAMRAYREWGRAERGIITPQIIVPATAHPAFDKAAAYFKMRITKIPVNMPSGTIDLSRLIGAITPNTVAIVASCPSWPHGTLDPVQHIASIARTRRIPCHVDACLGSFVVACMESSGFDMPAFDFRVPGVTSLSCDTHKFGFAPKGTSVLLYRSPELRAYQYFTTVDWMGGMYASHSVAGSRPGGLIAATWAAMMYTGKQGYVAATKKVVNFTRELAAGIDKMPDLEVIGHGDTCVVAFRSTNPNLPTLPIGEAMGDRGWKLNLLQKPDAVHLAVTLPVANGGSRRFLDDLAEAVEQVKSDPKAYAKGTAAIYGSAKTVPKMLVESLVKKWLDVYYTA
ncbi:unnamed protein product [Vitrella brassicaformis CCMP3155]|uniref:sphinganine-1-phosphate aldolase n=2 Tax=Vitrella brassicaformis TaxID=1169539 RepID=A0A0G4EK82_VITBC|nr:unnamed protein product [Vitrella brassicaformis CCMP3155]|eukprot:CEL96937.1 unnamed protein product [Vitrella brassicaformis CCMP3155]